MSTCHYCKYYKQSKLVGRPDSDGVQWKKCRIKKKKIQSKSNECKYFDPAEIFFCDKYGCQLAIANCLHRRFNPKKFLGWQKCKRCRQFEQDISEISNSYMVERKKAKRPPIKRIGRVINRRIGKPKVVFNPNKKRKLKRRESKSVRKIKRREVKPIRKIKRRN
jgi:hypothetical protein